MKNTNMALQNLKHSTFNFLVKSQFEEQKKEALMHGGMLKADLTYRRYRAALINRTLSAIGIPVFVWLLLETFFK